MPDEPFKRLTADEFIARFGDDMAGANIKFLKDVACSWCGHRESFIIHIRTQVELFDGGVGNQTGDNEFDSNSIAQCMMCGSEGILSDFTIEGLDARFNALEK